MKTILISTMIVSLVMILASGTGPLTAVLCSGLAVWGTKITAKW